MSDPGNAFALLGTSATPPDWSVDPLILPDRPYARGGHRFTNGPTWIEQFARSRGLARYAGPAFAGRSPFASNFAVGAARARDVDGSLDCPIR